MLEDARSVPAGTVIDTAVCVIGAGPAGIALARALDSAGLRTCLLESGGFEPDRETQSLYEGVNSGTILREHEPYLSRSRIRAFGGTTVLWWGWCIPLREIDFEEREWIPHSGWPFSRAVLDPYYSRAASLFEIEPFEGGGSVPPDRPPLLEGSDEIQTDLFHISPVFVGTRYRDELVRSENVTIYLHANVVDLQADTNASKVESVRVACLDGNRFTVRARRFVLAAGGIENARLLLASGSVQKDGLGNDHGLVGRFFADHPHLDAGHMVVSDADRDMSLYEFLPDRKQAQMGFLSLTDRAMREHGLPSLRVWLRPVEPEALPNLSRAVGRSVAHLDARAGGAAPRDGAGPPALRFFGLNVCCDTTPNPENRVTLIDDRDALGNRRVKLEWRIDPEDNRSVRRSMALLGRELGRTSRGRVRLLISEEAPWPDALPAAHHMGTTRMHRDPQHGVVDENGRVHGLANLYAAGGSVFPTGGYANPTLTIVALALRLADHLKQR
jgi:choline dehydrogenase-like flavoprotein